MSAKRSKNRAAAAALLAFLWVSATMAAVEPEVERFARRYLDLLVETSPVEATFLGIHTRDREFPDFSPRAVEGVLKKLRKLQRDLRRGVKPETLSPNGRMDYDLLDHRIEAGIVELGRVQTFRRNPAMYVEMPMEAIFIMVSRDYAPLEQRAADVLARMEKAPRVLEQGRRNLQNPPRLWTEIAIEQAGEAESFFGEMIPVLKKALPAREKDITKAGARALAAYRDYVQFLKSELLPRSSGSFAAGPELFAFYLRNNYFLTRDAESLRQMGQRIFEETTAEMERVARRIDPSKPWPELLKEIQKNHPKAADVLDVYRREVQRARQFLIERGLITFPAGEQLRVIETPVFQRATVPYAQYFQPAPFEKSRTGFFSVTTVDPKQTPEQQEAQLRGHNYADIVDTVTHEAYPGHHLQLALAAGVGNTMRKIVHTSIFSEGWGLYSEELMAEQGYYDDRVRLLQLQWVLVRAARILIDVGLHTRGMSMEDAVNFLVDRVHLERQGAVGEVRRYTLNPTRPLSYLTGRQLLLEMREEMRRRDGPAFSLKKFHDAVLQFGSIPPDLIRRVVLPEKGFVP